MQPTTTQKHTLTDIINENIIRCKQQSRRVRDYNPITGRCAVGKRHAIIDPHTNQTLYLPIALTTDPNFDKNRPNRLRAKYDFEYWCSTSYLDNRRSPLTPNLAQRKIISTLERLRADHRHPARLILMHSSQIGATEICEAYIYWLQHIVTPGSDAALFYPDGATRREAKYTLRTKIHRNPDHFTTSDSPTTPTTRVPIPSLLTYGNDSMTSFLITRTNVGARSLDARYILFTDCTRCTPKRRYQVEYYDRLRESYRAANPSTLNDNIVILESTPCNRYGNGFFFDSWQQSRRGDSNLTPLFMPWYSNPDNRKELPLTIEHFCLEMDEYEHLLWEHTGCTLEQINWYRDKKTNLAAVPSELHHRYPTTEQEAIGSLAIQGSPIDRKATIRTTRHEPVTCRHLQPLTPTITKNRAKLQTNKSGTQTQTETQTTQLNRTESKQPPTPTNNHAGTNANYIIDSTMYWSERGIHTTRPPGN